MESAARTPKTVLDEIATHARGDDLARLVHTVAFAAFDEKRPRLDDGLAEIAERTGITREDAETTLGNVLATLERGSAEPAGSDARALLAALLARGVALSPPDGEAAEARVAEALVWLSTSTPIDALSALDATLGDKAAGLWRAVAALIRAVETGKAPLIGRAGALIAAAALQGSSSGAARDEAEALAGEAHDPVARALLKLAPPGDHASGAGERASAAERRASTAGALSAEGEIVAPPRGPVALVLLGVTGVLALMHLGRLIGRHALRYRRPAELRVHEGGVTVLSRTELLGRTLRTDEVHVPRESLLRAAREVRYPRLALYAGLVALALGSYLGVSLFVDGARAGSPELLGMGLLLVALGVGLDFALENIAPATRGRCRVVITPRKGRALALGGVDPTRADLALKRLLRPAT
jgi:hypothetical protein